MTGPDVTGGGRAAAPWTRTRRAVLPVFPGKRPVMTVLVPLAALSGAGRSPDITGGLWAHGSHLALSSPTGPVLAGQSGHGSPSGRPKDNSGLWLRNAAVGLCVLAAAAVVVSFTAQYQMVVGTRHLPVIAALEAAIPDAAAVVFACLGVALALHGRRALRARSLNLASVSTSVFMNAIAAAPGWRELAIWIMPPVAYALASDTLIGVVRARAIARHHHLGTALASDTLTPLAALGAMVLWLLRLAMAPPSTLSGFRSWVLEECPVAPGRRTSRPPAAPARIPAPDGVGRQTKTARFLALVTEQHGPLALVPLDTTSRIAAVLAPEVGLDTGAARTALRKAVLTAQNRGPR